MRSHIFLLIRLYDVLLSAMLTNYVPSPDSHLPLLSSALRRACIVKRLLYTPSFTLPNFGRFYPCNKHCMSYICDSIHRVVVSEANSSAPLLECWTHFHFIITGRPLIRITPQDAFLVQLFMLIINSSIISMPVLLGRCDVIINGSTSTRYGYHIASSASRLFGCR
jgi:hypothetical protein